MAGRVWRAVVAGRGAVLAERVERADTFWSRLRGLLGRRLAAGEGLLLVPCGAIHTWFLPYPIYAAFLDGEGRVLAAAVVPPWRWRAVPRARQVLELPAAVGERTPLAAGDRVRLEPALKGSDAGAE